jgi:small subunit ribosomal protein S17
MVQAKNEGATKPKLKRGKVVSHKMDKTVVVAVERVYTHPLLKKVMRSIKNYKVHDEHDKAQVGDVVDIYEGRPVSKTKYMYLHKVLPKGATT